MQANPNFLKGQLKYLVLKTLAEEEMHGYAISKKIYEKSSGMWKPSAGALYPALKELLETGQISVKTEKGGRKRKTYTITGKGRESLKAKTRMVNSMEKEFMLCLKKNEGLRECMNDKENLFQAIFEKFHSKKFAAYRGTILEFALLHTEGKISRVQDLLFEKKLLEMLEALRKINEAAR